MTETDPWRIELKRRAEAVLAAFIEANPEYSIDKEQPECRGGTNFITFGTCRDQPVVYKRFDWLPRKVQEGKALRLMAPTGLVPKLYPIEHESMLIMERLCGLPLTEVEKRLPQDQVEQLYHQMGQAIAKIVEAAPGTIPVGRDDLVADSEHGYEFYCQASVRALFDTVTQRSDRVLAENIVPDADLLADSLRALQQNRELILSYPSFVQMDDFHSHNIIVDGPRLLGFIDLEMTRYGNEVLLLAAAVNMTRTQPALWTPLRRGYEDYRGSPIDSQTLHLAKIAAPFGSWIRFMWYWTTDPKKLEEGETTRLWPIRDIKSAVFSLRNMET